MPLSPTLQIQVQRTSSIKPTRISKIFLTHAHGDHTFGLPGLMCLIGSHKDRSGAPLEIYGPEGLRMWLRVAIRYSIARIVPPYRVHELMDIPMAPEWCNYGKGGRTSRYHMRFGRNAENLKRNGWRPSGLAGQDPESWISLAPRMDLEPSSEYGEVDGGSNIYPFYDHPLSSDGAPVWEVLDENDVRVYAAPMSHKVPCVGYAVREADLPGRLRGELVEPLVKRNLEGLRAAGYEIPMKAMATIKNLPEGGSFKFPDGTVVSQSDVVEPTREGRKIVILGDTADARAIANLAKGADVLVHEATNTFLEGVDSKDTTPGAVAKDTVSHGHSTPIMAGEFAKKVGAKRLLLNHFSPRYKGDAAVDSVSIMTRIERQAKKASDLEDHQVAAAWDMMILPVPHSN